MTDGEAFLEAQGFTHVENDEPHEDHWIMEGMPDGLALLVEKVDGSWSIHRDPRGDEPRGEWTDMAAGLSPSAMIETVSAQLERAGISVDLTAGNHAARKAAEAYGLSVNPRIGGADLR